MKEREKPKVKQEIVRVDGRLREILTFFDSTGKVLHRIASPVMIEFHPKDLMQIMVGASLLAVPVAFTEEVWVLGSILPMNNILTLLGLSLLFIGAFVYYNYYRNRLRKHFKEFAKRVLSTYVFSFLTVSVLLTVIQKAPWTVDWVLAFKRVVLVGFPASMSAAVADMIK